MGKREEFVAIAKSYLGCKESDGSHRKIIDLYNSHKPLARGYKVTYKDAWCSTFVSACAIKAGITDIIPTECSCSKQIELLKKLGEWQENDAYIPKTGELIFYDWQDNGVGDCKGWSDHVGIVVSVTGDTIKVIEGNKNDAVGYRYIKINGKYIRGYGVPKFPIDNVDKIAKEVINGKWGNGEERKRRLTAAGYDYATIQKRVNEMLK